MGKLMKKHRRLFAIMAVIAVLFSLVRPENFKKVSAADPNTDQVATGNDAAQDDSATSGDAGEIKTADSSATEIELIREQNATVDVAPAENDQKDDTAEPAEDIVDESAKTLVVRVEESGCTITINAPEGSLPYPQNQLSVSARELKEDTIEYLAYLSQAAEALGQDGTEGISYARFFDIEILRNGEKIEPLLPVEVKIEYDEAPVIADDAELSVVHFAEEGTEVISDIDMNYDATEIVYEQESFSVTGTIVADSSAVIPDKKGKTYVLIAQYNSKYYMVDYDGSLKELSEDAGNVTADTFRIWTYIKIGEKNYLRYVAEGYDYDNNDLPTNYGYTYIDPTVSDGLSSDVPSGVVNEITQFDSPIDHCAINIESGHIKTSDNKYLKLNSAGNKIVGNGDNGDGVVFCLAEVSALPDFFNKISDDPQNLEYGQNMAQNHQVNHIDISIFDKVTATIPLAYGSYYDKNGNKLFTVTSDTTISVTQKLNITQDTLRDAKLKAYDKDGNELDNAFVITGYSSNPADNNENTVQIRIEGLFKVSTAPVTAGAAWQSNTGDYPAERLANKVTYSLEAVQHDVEFKYFTEEYGQLYDSRGNELSLTTDVNLNKEKFGYFEKDNTCPALNYYKSEWELGKIWITGTTGMDFTIAGVTDIQMDLRPVAIEITNDIRDAEGNIIKPASAMNIKFNVYQNTTNPDMDSVVGQNVGSYQGYDVNSADYTDNLHNVTTTIDTSGSGLEHDHMVERGMVYVEEDIDTVPDEFFDTEGNLWTYKYSYIETEYVNRLDGNENKNHVSDKASSDAIASVPEYLGPYTVNSTDGQVDRFSSFLEFFAHNVYEKVTPPKKEEVTPYEGTGTLGGVRTGEEITYKITYTNYKSVAADVTITDTLDENVVFVSATDDIQPIDGVLTWIIQGVQPGKEGSVTVTVRVKENVPNLKEVINGGDKDSGHAASVKVGDGAVYYLDEVVNPVYDPVKQEVNPYVGTNILGGVNVGDSITYEISYKNYKGEKADIVITDKLDKNVEFVNCSDDGVYNEATHTVTWTLKAVAADKEGTVNLTVKVLEGALEENGGLGVVINGGNKESGHATSVKVGTDNEFYVEEVINPVPKIPAKREIAPYEGFGVLGGVDPGTEITYEILFKNYKTTAADVVISDELDENVEFVEASDGGVHDEDTHTVTWTLKQVAAKKEGRVTLTVVVLEDALESEGGPGKVVNGGNTTTVKVGDDQEVSLDVVENPVPKYPSKKETAPYEGNGVLGAVTVDEIITYVIDFQNYKDYDADVVITDQLDPNVEFVDASDDGVYDEETHTVTWIFEDYYAGSDNYVWVDVKVLESALESNGGPGKVVNGGETSTVRVGNDAAYTLEIVENPVPELPVKVEIAPYEGAGSLGPVSVGDEIIYELFYKNYKDEAVDIYIYDPLDYYVDFISASDDGEYDEEDHSVEWIIKDVPAGEEGSVTLTVKVLKDALVSEDGDGYVINGEDAFVQVGDDWQIYYNIVQNPVPDAPIKRETAPYKGNGVLGAVKVGDEISYEITYSNYQDTYQNIVIMDKLDPNVEFVKASDNGKYDKATHTVTWLLEDVPDGEDGKVTLTVKVLEGALKSNGGPGKVVNGGKTATVKVGDDDEFTLDMVENPVDEEEPPVVEEPPVDEEVGNLAIIVTEKGTGRPVPGAVVEVKNPKGKTTEYTTDEAGKVTLTDIPVGDYTVTIKKVPDGYNVTTDEVMTATVVAGKTTTVEFKIIPPTDTAVKTGDPMQLMPFMLVMLISMAGMILVIRRKRKQDR